jgi:DNA repair ATPase RecN
MTIDTLKNEISEIDNLNLMKCDDETLEDAINRLEELLELTDTLNEMATDDGETSEMMEQIEDLQYSINAELDSRYDEAYEEDY